MAEVLSGNADQHLLDQATGCVDWQKINASMKAKAAKWASREDVNASLIAMRACMRPCLSLMHQLLRQAGLVFDRRQQALLATGQPRQYRVLQAPELTAKTGEQISKIFHLTPQGFSERDMVRKTRALMFRLLATCGGALGQLLGSDRAYPYRMFAAVLSGNGRQVLDDPSCLYDELTFKLVRKYPSPDALESFEAKALVCGLAEMTMLDIAGIEARHAAARRVNTVRSTQASTASFETLSGLILVRSIMKARSDWLHARGFSSVQKAQRRKGCSSKKKMENKKTVHRGGGAWRAFQHLEKRGFGKQQAMSRDYRRIKSQDGPEFAALRELGRLGNAASRAGFRSFGARVQSKRRRRLSAATLSMPETLLQQVQDAKQSCAARKKTEQATLEAQMTGLAQHAAQQCAALQQARAVDDPASGLAQAVPDAMLPVTPTPTASSDSSAQSLQGLQGLQGGPLSIQTLECRLVFTWKSLNSYGSQSL